LTAVYELGGASALQHGTSRTGRWLRATRLKLALAIAVVEGILVVTDVIPGWLALVVAAGVILFYLVVGRGLRSDAVRQVSWIGAASQVFVALVPVLFFVVGALALIAVAILAVIALVALFADRR
jgi:hypothetical protein